MGENVTKRPYILDNLGYLRQKYFKTSYSLISGQISVRQFREMW